jgi:hypothetical protein
MNKPFNISGDRPDSFKALCELAYEICDRYGLGQQRSFLLAMFASRPKERIPMKNTPQRLIVGNQAPHDIETDPKTWAERAAC